MNIPYGVPRIAFVLYILIALGTFAVLGILAFSPAPFSFAIPLMVATVHFSAVFISSGKDGQHLYTKYTRVAPMASSLIFLMHACATAAVALWAVMNVAGKTSNIAFIMIFTTPAVLTAVVAGAVWSVFALMRWIGGGKRTAH